MSWVTVLRKMRVELNNMGFRQVPQLTSSRMIDVNQTMHIVPPGSKGRRRAVLIGINYVGQQGTPYQTNEACQSVQIFHCFASSHNL